MAKTFFYVVTYTKRSRVSHEDTFQDEMVLTRPELVTFLRKGCKFDSIRPLERSDFSNPNLFEQENENG